MSKTREFLCSQSHDHRNILILDFTEMYYGQELSKSSILRLGWQLRTSCMFKQCHALTFDCAAKTQNKYSERAALLFLKLATFPGSSEWKVQDTAPHSISSKNYILPFAPGNPTCQNNWQKPFLYPPQRQPGLQRHSGLFSAAQHPPPAGIQALSPHLCQLALQ